MSDKTKIEWSDATWNPVTGCTKVSEGCRNCYAQTFAERFRGTPGHYFENGFDITIRPEKLDQPLRWKRPRKIFVNSMSDLFHEDVPFDYIDQVFAVMALCPQHTFQVLTKRPDRMVEYMRKPSSPFATDKLSDLSPYMEHWGWVSPEDAANIAPPGSILPKWPDWPLPNVWLGVSVENQKAADERIPLLLETPAAVRFLSCEPLLGPVDIGAFIDPTGYCCGGEPEFCHCLDDHPRDDDGEYVTIDWVIVGGESGPRARQMHPDWARNIRDQCQKAGVPFFFKQWGEWVPAGQSGQFNGRLNEKPTWHYYDTPYYRVGKKKAGRLLDGREWNEMPNVAVTT